MKQLYLFCICLCCIGAKSQIINFPDITFKQTLLYASDTHLIAQNLAGEYFAPDTNGDGEIEVSEAEQVKSLNFFTSGAGAADFTGIEYFINLESIDYTFGTATTINFSTLTHFKSLLAQGSGLMTLDFSNCPDLRVLYCPNSQLTSLNLSGVTQLESLDVSGNQLEGLEVHAHSPTGTFGDGTLQLHCYNNNLNSLIVEGDFNEINCTNNVLTTLDFSNCTYSSGGAISYYISDNLLTSINFKNGIYDIVSGSIGSAVTLQYICADEGMEIDDITSILNNDGVTGVEVNSYCTIPPGGQYFTMQGTSHFDADGNGCDDSDSFYGGMHFQVTNQFTAQSQYCADNSGDYTLWLPAGTYTVAPQLENPSYFTVSPNPATITFNSQAEPVLQDFCIAANGSHPDLSISITPLNQARPGFDSNYKVVYKNTGSTVLSGSASLDFEDDFMDLIASNPAASSQQTGQLAWEFTGLQPFESRTILLTFNLNTPAETPAVNGGDILGFTAAGNISGDENSSNNASFLAQTVVNSLDPNDKTCLQGSSVSPDMIGKYVDYQIRFENTGTANAENIIVKDVIDEAKFDLSTLIPGNSSHPFFTRINGSKAEFVFQNINLPFEDGNNDGYFTFKIKTLPTLTSGDSFSNTAGIYFDYNFPIVTNTATTDISELAAKDFTFEDYFTIYPVPAVNALNIKSDKGVSISSLSIYNMLGQLVLTNIGSGKPVDISALKSGNYLVKVFTSKGVTNTKFIKQ